MKVGQFEAGFSFRLTLQAVILQAYSGMMIRCNLLITTDRLRLSLAEGKHLVKLRPVLADVQMAETSRHFLK